MFGLDQHCESLVAPLRAFGGIAALVKEKFRGGMDIFVKVGDLLYFVSFCNPVGFASNPMSIKGHLMLCNICTSSPST